LTIETLTKLLTASKQFKQPNKKEKSYVGTVKDMDINLPNVK